MKRTSLMLGVTFSLLWSLTAHADTDACSSAQTTKTYFVNGVWNSFSQATDSLILIADAYQEDLESQYPEQKFEFDIAYNHNRGWFADILEVIGQKLEEIDDQEASNVTPMQYMNLFLTTSSVDDIVPISAIPIFEDIEEYMADRMTDTVDASAHIQKYRNDLMEGKRVVLIAHSQGNLFANKAVSTLMGKYASNIGMVGVASPAAVTYNNSPYYTAHDDRVIDALRLIHDVLPSNIDNDPGILNDPRDLANHAFAASYFAPVIASRSEIDTVYCDYIADLVFPNKELGSGAITVTLTWGFQPDVDLHVYEPNGTHVFYVNLQGNSGYLDLDDVTSFGPEHYYVACDALETGTYRVGLNFFDGSAATLTQVQISTADGNTRTFKKILLLARGPAGDFLPIGVATITVSMDEDDNYLYEVE